MSLLYAARPSLAVAQEIKAPHASSDTSDAIVFAQIVGRFQGYVEACGKTGQTGRLLDDAIATVRKRYNGAHLTRRQADDALWRGRLAVRAQHKGQLTATLCSDLPQEELVVRNAVTKEKDPNWRALEPLAP